MLSSFFTGCSIQPNSKGSNSSEQFEWREPVTPPDSAEIFGELVRTQENDLNAIWGTEADDIFSVGDNGTIIHFDGTVWTRMDSPTNEDLLGLWGYESNNVYAVGSNGTCIQYDGQEWRSLDCGTDAILTNIRGFSDNDIYVSTAFNSGKILHFNGNDWETINTPLDYLPISSLFDIWGDSQGKIYVVGSSDAILQWDGSQWNIISIGEMLPSCTNSIWGSNNQNIFMIDGYGYIKHFDGKTLNVIKETDHSEVMSIWGTSSDNIYAVGRANFYASILHYNGNEWIEMRTEKPLLNIWFNDIWGVSKDDIYIVGDSGYILHHHVGH